MIILFTPIILGINYQMKLLTMGDYVIEVPTHKKAPKNPIKRAEMRYKLLEKKICMKP